MAQCIEAVNALSSQQLQEMKSLFWNQTTLTETIKSWFTQLSAAFLRHREQIRILSVYSCSPEVDLHVISAVKKYMTRFRYVVVEPVNSRVFEKTLMTAKQSSLHGIEISPYPHFLTFETLERFDLILIFGLPINRNIANIVIRKSKMLLRPGGQACIFDPADNDLGVLINLLYSTAEDCQPGTPTYTTIVHEKIISPDKEEMDDTPCTEEIALSPVESSSHSEADHEVEKISGRSKTEEDIGIDFQSDQYPCDANYIRMLLDHLNYTYSRSTLGCEIDISECLNKTNVGINILSGLMKIDLSGALDELLKTILEFLQVRLIDNTTIMPYNYHQYTIFSDVMAEVIHRTPVTTPTPWFPQGERGSFVNVGYERWKKRLDDWRADGAEEPVKKMSSKSVNAVVDAISSVSNTKKTLPEPINLDELLPLCSEIWKCESSF